jgi:hypothetical protein
MPTYHFENRVTRELHDDFMSISEMEKWMEQNPDWEPVMQPTVALDPMRMGIKKPDARFTDLLKGMKKAYKGSTIDTF